MVEKKTKYGQVIPDGYHTDPQGNVRSFDNTEIKDGKIYVSYNYILEPGKTTLRTEHSKLEREEDCLHKDRLSCNYGDGFSRCEHMKYVNGYWKCVKLTV
jgi:hypothetical protein